MKIWDSVYVCILLRTLKQINTFVNEWCEVWEQCTLIKIFIVSQNLSIKCSQELQGWLLVHPPSRGQCFYKCFGGFLAIERDWADVILIGQLFHSLIASVMHVFCMIGLIPGTISLPCVHALVLMLPATISFLFFFQVLWHLFIL